MNQKNLFILILAVVYFLSPVDLLPVLHIDDIVFIVVAVAKIVKDVAAAHEDY